MSFWKNDNFFVGITVGMILTAVTTFILITAVPILYKATGWFHPNSKILLLSVVPGIIMMRYYMRRLNYMKSGSGILTVVFISIILYFLVISDKVAQLPSLF